MSDKVGFLARHEFFLRRLHSLTGLVPVGAYMCVHLLVIASVLDGPDSFQKLVYQIHSLGNMLPVVEWTFIFLPILFHGIYGLVIIRGGLPNSTQYSYASNVRYTLQRFTGLIAFVYILGHVFHLHGWFHFELWLENVAKPFGGYQFRAYNAASSLAASMGPVMLVLYFVGVMSCVFHLANGVWTMGITWGLWLTPRAQARANWLCWGLGTVLSVLSIAALIGTATVDKEQAKKYEDQTYEARVSDGDIRPNDHKRVHTEEVDSKESARVDTQSRPHRSESR